MHSAARTIYRKYTRDSHAVDEDVIPLARRSEYDEPQKPGSGEDQGQHLDAIPRKNNVSLEHDMNECVGNQIRNKKKRKKRQQSMKKYAWINQVGYDKRPGGNR